VLLFFLHTAAVIPRHTVPIRTYLIVCSRLASSCSFGRWPLSSAIGQLSSKPGRILRAYTWWAVMYCIEVVEGAGQQDAAPSLK
jgi:hypothetical protein